MDELYTALKNDLVEIVFTKSDGSTRVMTATLQESLLPERSETTTTSKKVNQNVTAVWSIEDEGWRAFKNDSIISWKTIS
jgi:hypothetical protein